MTLIKNNCVQCCNLNGLISVVRQYRQNHLPVEREDTVLCNPLKIMNLHLLLNDNADSVASVWKYKIVFECISQQLRQIIHYFLSYILHTAVS